jgi:hypothetical protein
LTRILTQSLALFLLTATIAWITLNSRAQHTTLHQYTLTAVVFQSGSPASPTFTFQGVFSNPQTGNPINGPTNIRIGIGDGPADSDPILSLTEAAPTYSNGRFTAEVDLLDPQDMLDIADPHIVLLSADGNDTPLIPRIPMRYTPYAWTSEYAREAVVAQEADVAQEAELSKFAQFAAQASNADSLTSTSVAIPITGNNWSPDQNSPPTATRRGNLVFLSGLASRGLPAASVFAQLPEGYRPATDKRILTGFSPNTIPVAVEVRISTDGNLRLLTTVNSGSLWLDGIVFEAAP